MDPFGKSMEDDIMEVKGSDHFPFQNWVMAVGSSMFIFQGVAGYTNDIY